MKSSPCYRGITMNLIAVRSSPSISISRKRDSHQVDSIRGHETPPCYSYRLHRLVNSCRTHSIKLYRALVSHDCRQRPRQQISGLTDRILSRPPSRTTPRNIDMCRRRSAGGLYSALVVKTQQNNLTRLRESCRTHRIPAPSSIWSPRLAASCSAARLLGPSPVPTTVPAMSASTVNHGLCAGPSIFTVLYDACPIDLACTAS